jgi:hypothetical protein
MSLPALFTAAAILLLAGCGASQPKVESRLPLSLPASPPQQPAPAEQPPPATVALVKHFDAAKKREIAIVLGSAVTAEQIAAIRAADKRARAALTNLGRGLPHARKADMDEARAAVRGLEDALAEPLTDE